MKVILLLSILALNYNCFAGGGYRSYNDFIFHNSKPFGKSVPIDSVSLNLILKHVDNDTRKSSKAISQYIKQAKDIAKKFNLDVTVIRLKTHLSKREKDGLIFSSKTQIQYSMPFQIQFKFSYKIGDVSKNYFEICTLLNNAIQKFNILEKTNVKVSEVYTGISNESKIHMELIQKFTEKIQKYQSTVSDLIKVSGSGLNSLKYELDSPLSRFYYLDAEVNVKFE
ncbi:MAG: hypothetical protein KC646_05415 [Candidatus Cloacimonetes bacterium]|nr:hypothetical protein [Candidatus Cloacimonadota bacterium]